MHYTETDELWYKVLQIIKNELNPQSYNSWFKQTKINKFEDNELIISVPNNFSKGWLENHYTKFIKNILEKNLNLDKNVKIKFQTTSTKSLESNLKNKKKEIRSVQKNNINVILKPKYTFDNFVVGNSNRFSHAACFAVAQSPGKAYNPLFVYGGVGLGKTHLMKAIDNYITIHNNHKKFKVLYISSEKFTNELINAIKDDRTVAFRNKYRSVDVLLIDDIQFLAGKERTQEEFFHTFNTLYESNKQIVITSDRPPKEITTLEDRLISRFESGLTTDISPPDFETRVAILRKKAQTESLGIPDDLINFIASKIVSNIRQLEGALTKLTAYSNLTKINLSIPLAKEILKDIIPLDNKEISINQIQKAISEYFNIKLSTLLSKKRVKNIVEARQIAIYLSRELTDLSLPAIGDTFGGKDHTTILYSYNKIKDRIKKDNNFKNTIENIILKIKNG